ncbi:hypothetical protein [Acidihalobacter ferrooxydans]|uniref:4a-hydroxytetrahydrobiopterin dehydratase n=1 Tax=Acidihalobacter ferrooxydans TaxID=1765967 RepID=A0A1P8UI45_9GAMM|nr:hypothetical protein [Acidihalobacter ferrooxydans]APZ43499.1 hypothetical protein BW247_10715 [Acidihalobacter ferrooxydans]
MSLGAPEGWTRSGTDTVTWFKRFEFGDYAKLRTFLDALAELAKETGMHPDNIGFGRDYANISLETRVTDAENAALAEFAESLDRLAKTV